MTSVCFRIELRCTPSCRGVVSTSSRQQVDMMTQPPAAAGDTGRVIAGSCAPRPNLTVLFRPASSTQAGVVLTLINSGVEARGANCTAIVDERGSQ